ncbi:MAG: hypothetical protein KZQ95_14470 [Candidatus Thiodiazotropha sp. (ex Epidulcina cf. delphinae)]|nr:hypothetical protein [Candidatus Thiodiazotropha sp. (ex Epidulcina cf. delphinae)]
MTPWKTNFNGLSLLMLIGLVGLGGYFYYQWMNPFQPTQMSPNQSHAEAVASEQQDRPMPPFSPVPFSSFREISDRPLFVEGRLPPAKPVTAESPPPTQRKPLRLKLEGVAITPDSKVAIIRDLNSNQILRLSQGMNQNDWKVEAVDSTSAIILRDGERLRLDLEIENGSKKKKPTAFKPPFRPSKR